MSDKPRRQLTDLYPTYNELRHFLRILNGVPHDLYKSTRRNILRQRGTPEDAANWKHPNTWIPWRLHGEQQTLAMRIWQASGKELNPRWCTGPWKPSLQYCLLEEDSRRRLVLTPSGHDFIDNPEGSTVAYFDAVEGIMELLLIVSDLDPAPTRVVYQRFRAFCQAETIIVSPSTIRQYLYRRRRNLVDRCYVSRSSDGYHATEAGRIFLRNYVHLIQPKSPLPA